MLVMLEKPTEEMMDNPSEVMVQYVKVYIAENNKTYLNGSCLSILDDNEEADYDLNKYYQVNEKEIDTLIQNRNIKCKIRKTN